MLDQTSGHQEPSQVDIKKLIITVLLLLSS